MSKKSTNKPAPKPSPRMSKSAARADGAAKTKRALAEAKATVDANLKAIAAADQENAAKRDERATSPDAMIASERAMADSCGKEPKPKRRSGLDIAAEVLATSKEPLDTKTIAGRAVAAGWQTNGKTPHATLHAAIIREIAARGQESRFKKTEPGRFVRTND